MEGENMRSKKRKMNSQDWCGVALIFWSIIMLTGWVYGEYHYHSQAGHKMFYHDVAR
jgi:hypothetical protein